MDIRSEEGPTPTHSPESQISPHRVFSRPKEEIKGLFAVDFDATSSQLYNPIFMSLSVFQGSSDF
jgi:hypothetical protein